MPRITPTLPTAPQRNYTTVAVDHDTHARLHRAAELAGVRGKHGPSPKKLLAAITETLTDQQIADLLK